LTPLEPGDLVLLGPNLPHIWQRDEAQARQSGPVHILIVQFLEDFLGRDFWKLTAARGLQQLLARASVGLQFRGPTRERVATLMGEMRSAGGLRRLALFLTALEELAASPDARAIATPGFAGNSDCFTQDRMERVMRFINERLEQPIRLGEAARLAGLSEGAFSRFFRRHSGRTFPVFVNELRVGRACRLLAAGRGKISDVAFACGFSSLSNFNRQFQRMKRTTPREYVRRVSFMDPGEPG
jgi:AraC-like DNA-binding protein